MRVPVARIVARFGAAGSAKIVGHRKQLAGPRGFESHTPSPVTARSCSKSVPATTVTPTTPGVHDAAVCWSTTSAHRCASSSGSTNESSSAPARLATASAAARAHAASDLTEPRADLVDDVRRPGRAEPTATARRVEPPVGSTFCVGIGATRGTYCTRVAMRGSPIKPSAIARPQAPDPAPQRNSWPTSAVTPGFAFRRRPSPRPRSRRA